MHKLGGQREERETQADSVQSMSQGSIPWPQDHDPKADALMTEPPRCPRLFFF